MRAWRRNDLRVGEIQNEQVVSVSGAEKLGTVEDVYIDPNRQTALGLRVKRGGMLSKAEAVLLSDVHSIGLDAVTVPDGSRLNAESKFPQFANSLLAGTIIGSRMLTEHGHQVGTISDLDIDFETGAITAYVLSGSLLDRWRKENHTVPASAIKSIGEKLVVVSNDVAAP
jgi:uncharacterized protein YrrD